MSINSIKLIHLLTEALRDDIPQYMIDELTKIHGEYAVNKFLSLDVPIAKDSPIPNLLVEITDDSILGVIRDNLELDFGKQVLEQFMETEFFEYFTDFKTKAQRGAIYNAIPDNPDTPDESAKYNFMSTLIELRNGGLNNSSELTKYIETLTVLYKKQFRILPSKQPEFIARVQKTSNKWNTPYFVSHLKFSNNLTSLHKYIGSYNHMVSTPEFIIDGEQYLPSIEYDVTKDSKLHGLRDAITNYFSTLESAKSPKLYLYISDKPDDKLRMSISKFYTSCQNLYTGQHNTSVIGTVFDENTKIAYIIAKEPFKDNHGNEHPFTPYVRVLLRTDGKRIVMDEVYPRNNKKLKDAMISTIKSHIQSVETKDDASHSYTHSVTSPEGVPSPYMDTYQLHRSYTYSHMSKKDQSLMRKVLNTLVNFIQKARR
jgi:hypothetical protein